MIAFISPAKTMQVVAPRGGESVPRFLDNTKRIVTLMRDYTAREIEDIFRISGSLATELEYRFAALERGDVGFGAAIDEYDGVVYKHIKNGRELTGRDRAYLQEHVRISSLLYGLLRPLDLIQPYRMEGFVRLSDTDQRVDKYWREEQTQMLIDDVKSAGGTLVYLASREEQVAFHWKAVESAVEVIDVQFLQNKGDKLRQVIVYTKMARGEMVRYMMENRLESVEELKRFEWGGYKYAPELSKGNTWVWLM